MKVKIVVIEFEAPRWGKRAFALAAPVLAITVAGIVLASPPKQWTNGDALTANDLNGLTVMTGANGAKYSVGATHYCGQGPVMTNGAFAYDSKTGYAAAKAMCEASSGCGPSPTAHMCEAEEMSRSLSLGDAPPAGWYMSFTPDADDCVGWTTAANTEMGPISGIFGSGWAHAVTCNGSYPVLCCD